MTDAETRATVVVANADATVCEVLARIVEAAGHDAVRVTDPTQAGGAVISAPAEAVIFDLGAQNVDELRALRTGGHQRGVDARAVVIAMGPAAALLAWHAEADAVLTRPFPAADLAQTVAEVLGRTDDERSERRAHELAALSS